MIEVTQVLKGWQVLIVEDQYLVADQMSRAVRALGGQVVGPAPQAQAALDLIAGGAIDLAVLDVNLGGHDVYPAAMELERRGVPYIFATGYERWVIPQAFQDAPHLEKPVTARALGEAVARLGPRRA
jgi:CheY-like chemotaxis protein